MVQNFFYPMKIFFVIKKMNGLKITYNHEFLVLCNHEPTECFYFRKKRGRFLTFDWSKQRSTTHQNLSFFEAVKRNRIGWDGGISSSVFFLISFPRSLLFFPTFHFFISISAVCQSSRRAYAPPTTFSPWTSTLLLLSVMCDWVRKPAFLRRFKL